MALAEDLREGFRNLGEDVKAMQAWSDTVPAQRFTQGKLGREFATALREFQELQRKLAETQRVSVVRAKEEQAKRAQSAALLDEEVADDGEANNASSVQEQEHQQLLNQQELDYQQSLIQEREAEIQGIESGIEELNEIFTDLSAIVNEQGTIVGKYFFFPEAWKPANEQIILRQTFITLQETHARLRPS